MECSSVVLQDSDLVASLASPLNSSKHIHRHALTLGRQGVKQR